MTPLLPQVEAQALQLTSQERAQLAERLLLSLDVDTSGAWQVEWDEEIALRVAKLDAGEAELIPAERVMAQMQKKLGQR
jgi:putative addiction module component (TIGR02574 family)